MRAILIALLVAMFVVGAACDREEGARVPSPSPTTMAPTATVVDAVPTAPPKTVPTAGPPLPPPFGPPMPPARPVPPDARPSSGAALLDVASGVVTTLYEGETPMYAPRFEPDGTIWLNMSRWLNQSPIGEWRHFDAEGQLLETRGSSPEHWCPQYGTPDYGKRFHIGGRQYDGTCGSISPDQRHVYYSVNVDAAPDPDAPMGGASESWLLRVADGKLTRLTDRVGYMRNWEGYPAAAWSASGRYLIFVEQQLVPSHERQPGKSSVTMSRYLVDTETGTVTQFGKDRPGHLPVWSPRDDAFVTNGPGGASELVRPPSVTTVSFPNLPWPAQFDSSGRYLFTSAEPIRQSPDNERTTVMDAETGMVVARWRGAAHRGGRGTSSRTSRDSLSGSSVSARWTRWGSVEVGA